jgi:hypothetical protein
MQRQTSSTYSPSVRAEEGSHFCCTTTPARRRNVGSFYNCLPNRTAGDTYPSLLAKMRRLIPGTWLAYVLFLIPASVALASNANSRSRRLTAFRRIFDTVPYRGGSLTKTSDEIGSVPNEKIYSNDDILEILNGAVGVSSE